MGRRLGAPRPDSNPYARFVDGLQPIVDLNAMELLELGDTGAVPLPDTMGEYVPPSHSRPADARGPQADRGDPARGSSVQVDGYEVRWQKWSMRLGFNLREGLTIHAVGYEDQGRVRPIAHRMSFAEMVVPYRDPTPDAPPPDRL